MPETRVSLRVLGPEIDLESIVGVLGAGDKQFEPDDPSRPQGVRRNGIWAKRSTLSLDACVNEHIKALLNEAGDGELERVIRYQPRSTIAGLRISVCLSRTEEEYYLNLDADLIKTLARSGLAVQLDVYPFIED